MNLSTFVKIILFTGLLPFFSCKSKVEKKNKALRPNIIFIMSDDHAYQAISAYGYPIGKVAPTPHIDRIAEEGIRFNDAFVTNSLCGPSRAVILTGKYSHINGFRSNGDKFDGNQMTFPKLLQKAGYQTAIVGKWHLKSVPQGFDYWNILIGQGAYYNPDFIEMGDTSRSTGYATDLITDYALNWLKKKRDKNKPFFIMVHHKAPHRNQMPNLKNINRYDTVTFPVPDNYFDQYKGRLAASEQKMNIYRDMYEGYDLKMSVKRNSDSLLYVPWPNEFKRMTPKQSKIWKEKYRVRNNRFFDLNPKGKDLAIWKYERFLRDYMATIASVDESVGKILQYLDEHNLTKNTLVVYTSDQGFYLGEHGWFDKRWMYEQSFRTPLLIRYPKEIIAGSVSDKFVSNLDFAETFLDYAGIKIPEEMQGLSLRPILQGKKTKNWRDKMYYHYYEYPGFHMVKRHYGIRTKQYKLIHFYYDIDTWEFYDLKNDPEEMHNQINNARYKPVIDSLKSELARLMKYYKEPPYKEWKEIDILHGRKMYKIPTPHLKYIVPDSLFSVN